MRKTLPLIALAAVLALAAPAAAKTGVSLSSTPDGLAPGQHWDVTITPVFHDPKHPEPGGPKGIAIKSKADGRTLHFPARKTAPGDYHAVVVFPTRGTWTYSVTGFGHLPPEMNPEFPPVFIATSDALPGRQPGKSPGGDGFPIAAVLGGLGGAALLGLGLVSMRRRWPAAWWPARPR